MGMYGTVELTALGDTGGLDSVRLRLSQPVCCRRILLLEIMKLFEQNFQVLGQASKKVEPGAQ